jgi:hypothetical protein
VRPPRLASLSHSIRVQVPDRVMYSVCMEAVDHDRDAVLAIHARMTAEGIPDDAITLSQRSRLGLGAGAGGLASAAHAGGAPAAGRGAAAPLSPRGSGVAPRAQAQGPGAAGRAQAAGGAGVRKAGGARSDAAGADGTAVAVRGRRLRWAAGGTPAEGGDESARGARARWRLSGSLGVRGGLGSEGAEEDIPEHLRGLRRRVPQHVRRRRSKD